MRKKVFIARPVPFQVEQYIGRHCDYEIWRSQDPIPRDELLAGIKDAEGLITHGTKINEELLSQAPGLRIVCNISVGYDNLDIGALRKHGVWATHTPYVLDDTVADLVLGLMLAASRRIVELDAFIRAGDWKETIKSDLFGVDVHHATLGIIGMGRIGKAIAKRAKLGFDMNILYSSRTPKPELEEAFGAGYRSLDALLEQSDFVVLMTPLTPDTVNMMGAEQFRRMKPSAVFINASRGQTVDEAALVEALRSGTIRAAGLDVFREEPIPPDHPLLKLPNAVLVPHIGSATAQTRFNMAMLAAQNLVAAMRGDRPPNLIPELKDLP